MNPELYETPHYRVVIGASIDEPSRNLYHLVNKETGVTEAEVTVLPQSIMMADEFTSMLDTIFADELADAPVIEIATPHVH